MLQVATRKKVKIKLAISAPTGFGKTYSALLLAYGITNDWTKIAVIDSENESANLYSDLGPYMVAEIKPDFTVEKFCKAVDECVAAGMQVIIVDSTYHYWHGKGGLLEYNNKLGGRYQDWAKTTPLYMQWLDKILQTPVHFICTSRKKQAYEMVKVDGKTTVEKKGMEDEIRSGFDYEMTIAFNIVTANHLCEAGKDRTRLFTDKPEFVITSATGELIRKWCDEGIDVEQGKKDELKKALAAIKKAKSVVELTTIKKGLPDYLVSDASFVTAGKDRYTILMAEKPKEPAVTQ